MFNFLAHNRPRATDIAPAPAATPTGVGMCSWCTPFGTAPIADTPSTTPAPNHPLPHPSIYCPALPASMCRLPRITCTPKPTLQLLPPPEPAARRVHPGCEIEANKWHPHILALDRIRTWSSPYTKAHQHHLLAVLPASKFQKAYTVVISGLAPKTHENYAASLLCFHQYCNTHHISEGMCMPAVIHD
jgi:hypothetical protein